MKKVRYVNPKYINELRSIQADRVLDGITVCIDQGHSDYLALSMGVFGNVEPLSTEPSDDAE